MWDHRELSTREYRQMRKTIEDRIHTVRRKTIVRPTVEDLSGLVGPEARATWDQLAASGEVQHLPVILDITSTWTTKMHALTAHASQPITSHFAPMAETLGRLHGGRIGVRYAEAFAPVPILGRLPSTTHL